jgi:dihydroorotate dehydrogenase (NAD+) catalytic subunit
MSLCQAPPGELEFLLEAIGPGTRALAAVEPGDELHVFGPLGNGYRLDVEKPLLVGGGIGVAPLPYLSAALGAPPAVLGFRSGWHAEAARLVPNAEVVIDPTLVTEAMPKGYDVLACGPGIHARGRSRPGARSTARVGGADGVRLRRLLRAASSKWTGSSSGSAWTDRCSLLLNASGCLDALAAPEVASTLDAFVTKTVTPEPRSGNRPVRIAETEHGNAQLDRPPEPGHRRVPRRTLPRLAELGVPVWVSVGGFAARSTRDSAPRWSAGRGGGDRAQPLLPERRYGGRRRGARCGRTRRDGATLYAKLSAAAPDLGAARARSDAGADGLSLVNTIRGLALDERTLEPRLGPAVGGYSGPALKPVALAAVFTCYRETGLPIVGMGGIATGSDALEFSPPGQQRSRSAPSSSSTRRRRSGCAGSWRTSCERGEFRRLLRQQALRTRADRCGPSF